MPPGEQEATTEKLETTMEPLPSPIVGIADIVAPPEDIELVHVENVEDEDLAAPTEMASAQANLARRGRLMRLASALDPDVSDRYRSRHGPDESGLL